MTITKDRIEQVHPVYRDFMLALSPVISSRKQPFQIAGISESQVYDAAARKYGFDPQQFFEIALNLRSEGLVERDKFGFYSPTAMGEKFIRLLTDPDSLPSTVPPLNLGD